MARLPRPVSHLTAALAAVSLLALAGCATAVLTGAVETPPDGRSAAEIARDADLEAAVNARLARDPELASSAVTVVVRDRVVRLRGRLPSTRLRARAVSLARGVPGVRRVVADIIVTGR